MRYLIALTAGLLLTAPAFAENGDALAKKANCMGCHGVTNKSVGPAFKAVAEKYAGDKDAQAKLEKKVRSGGSGVWGGMAMPPTPASVGDADVKSIVQWILSVK
ncbi:MAG: c-type cytochrome [Pseudomonadota bacterium]